MPLRTNSASAIDAYLRKKGSPLAGLGSTFLSAGKKYGVDPRLLVAISGAETSLGQYGPSQRIKNPFGMGPHIQYGSYGESIMAAAKNLGLNYIGEGRDTIPEIQQKWAPSNAENDPTGLNNNWVKNVSTYYSEMGGDPDVSMELQEYLQTAADLESQYSGVGASVGASAPEPQRLSLSAGQEAVIDSVTRGPSQLAPLSRSLGQLGAGLAARPLEARDRGSQGSGAFAGARIREQMMAKMQQTATDAGLTFEWEDSEPLNPNAPALIQAAADYMQTNPIAEEVIAKGKSVLGTPYSWGGGGPSGATKGIGKGANTVGFDCSGLAQYLYAQQGINLPRTTYDQIKAGRGVKMKELMPGDLIFFGTKEDPHHEGIYIGGGQFIHAPRTGDVVKISSLTGYYKKNFVTGRRITRRG